jgi:hypothetical protein
MADILSFKELITKHITHDSFINEANKFHSIGTGPSASNYLRKKEFTDSSWRGDFVEMLPELSFVVTYSFTIDYSTNISSIVLCKSSTDVFSWYYNEIFQKKIFTTAFIITPIYHKDSFRRYEDGSFAD